MQVLPQILPLEQFLIFLGAVICRLATWLSTGSNVFAVILLRTLVLAVTAVAGGAPLWQTSFFDMQLLPQAFPFVQVRAWAAGPMLKQLKTVKKIATKF